MKKYIALALISLFSHNGFAGYTGIYSYDYWFPRWISEYYALLETPSPLELARRSDPVLQASFERQSCAPVLAKAVSRGQLDIRYALGYFDDSQGIDIVWDGINYGLSASLDIEVYHAMREALVQPCEGRRVTCGFKESGDPELGMTVYNKVMAISGKEVDVKITLTQASASNNFRRNKTELRDRQALLTAQSDENFFGGLASADIIFYNGHSRNGGGPDFNPPRLNSALHTDYDGYYRLKRPGITRVLDQIKKNPNQNLVYGSFSCFSYRHFYGMLVKANPKIQLILSSDTIDYLKSLQASLGYLEGLLQGRCGEDLAQFAKRDSLYKEFKGFNIR